MPGDNPLETALRGFVAISNSGPDGFAIGGYARDSASAVRSFPGNEDATVVSIKRARQVAREFHDWSVASEQELVDAAMRARL
jgi:hypothetical protein